MREATVRYTLMMGLGGYEDYAQIAQEAELAGWDAISVPDSIFFPKLSDSDYPYMDTEAVRQALEHAPVVDPLIAIAGMVAVTERIRFYPGVLKVPVRQPLVLAKAISSLALISGNRLSLGAGLSPWKEDFSYNGVEFEARAQIMDECIAIIRAALSGDYFSHHSEHFDIGEVKFNAVPDQPVPILIGGHAKPALRRAARIGDGWISANTDFDTLKELISQLNTLRVEQGTAERDDFEIHALDSNCRTVDDCRRLAELGVTDICVTPWNPYQDGLTRDDKLAAIRQVGENLIEKMS